MTLLRLVWRARDCRGRRVIQPSISQGHHQSFGCEHDVKPAASVRRSHEQSSDPKPMPSEAALCGQIVEKCIIRVAQRPHCPHGAGLRRYVICQFRVPGHETPFGLGGCCFRIVHCSLHSAIPSPRCDTVRPMWIPDLTGLIGTEASSKFFVRVVWPIMLLDQIED